MEEKEFQIMLSKKIKALILKSGKKQKELAEEMGVKNTFISGILNEREKTSVYRMNQMLESMGKPSLLDWLDSLIRNEPEKKTAFMNSSQSLHPSSKRAHLTAISTPL